MVARVSVAAAAVALAAAGLASAAQAASWTPTGSLATGRNNPVAALLLDGRPIVTGGSDQGQENSLASTEIFDPATGTWPSGGDLGTARYFHTATTLESGTVLVAGGFNIINTTMGTGFLKSAELYDPSTNMWSPATNMGTGQERDWHTATLIGDGRVWVAGGFGGASQNGLTSTRLYNPAMNSWSAGPSLITGRLLHTATLLANGKVLIVGGRGHGNQSDVIKSAELYDPRAMPGSQMSSAGNTTDARESHTATLLQDGRVLVVGGTDGTNTLKTAELYHPSTNSWSKAANLPGPREGHTATLLRNGQLLVAGGDDGNNTLKSTVLYNPATNAWSPGPTMHAAREGGVVAGLLGGRVLAAAGNGQPTGLKSAELYTAIQPNAVARRPVVAYLNNGHLGLYDSQTHQDLPVPPLPAGLTRFSISQNGRYIVYLDPTSKHIHLFDRYVHHELSLPGIDASDHGNNLMSVSNTGLIAFDHDGSDTTQVYDSKAKHLIDTGLPADNAHRQPSISADGHYVATTCLDHCVAPTVDGDDAYVQDLRTKQNVPFPDDLAGPNGGEEHPCINGDGSLVGIDITKGMVTNIYLYSLFGGDLLPVPNDPAAANAHCALDQSGQHVVLENFGTGVDRLYDRLTGALVPLPSKIQNVVYLSSPVLQPPDTRITRLHIKSKKRTASFSFAGVGPTKGFQCELIRPKRKHHPRPKASFTSCRSPQTYTHLGLGKYTFKVRAFNAAGIDATPATRTFKIKKVKHKKHKA
jgi:Kelch motif/Galactose oxidase, central domain